MAPLDFFQGRELPVTEEKVISCIFILKRCVSWVLISLRSHCVLTIELLILVLTLLSEVFPQG
jgi:hypothetical protein